MSVALECTPIPQSIISPQHSNGSVRQRSAGRGDKMSPKAKWDFKDRSILKQVEAEHGRRMTLEVET